MLPVWKDERFGRVVLIGSRAALGKENRVLYGAKGSSDWPWPDLGAGIGRSSGQRECDRPWPIATDLFEPANYQPSPYQDRSLIPLGRVGKPEDIAQATSFLLGDKSGFITGQCLNVCGGLSTGFSAQ